MKDASRIAGLIKSNEKEILADWANTRTHFVKVMPHEYRRALVEAAKRGAALPATETATV